jgi:RNA-directed DNA polymerase
LELETASRISLRRLLCWLFDAMLRITAELMRAARRFKARIREPIQCTRGVGVEQLIGSLKRYLTGWRG